MATKAHQQYPLVPKEQAQGIAWSFEGPNTDPVEYPFTFPEIKDDEVRIQQSYFGLCYTDCHLVNQDWFNVNYPIVPGHEILGRVVAKGKAVNNVQLGDLVGVGFIRDNCGKCRQCLTGFDQICGQVAVRLVPGLPLFGGFASHVQLAARWAFPVPPSIPENVAPPLMCAGITMYAPLKRHFRPNGECAIIGIGGLGHMGIMFSSKLGMKTTAVSTSANKRDEALTYGATDFIVSTDEEQMKKNAKRFDLVVCSVHASNTQQFISYLNLVKRGGTFVLVGIPPVNTSEFGIPFFLLIGEQINIVGSIVGNRAENYEMLEFAAKHKIYPVCEEFEFANFKGAYNHLLKGQPRYRCVVKVGEAGNLKQ